MAILKKSVNFYAGWRFSYLEAGKRTDLSVVSKRHTIAKKHLMNSITEKNVLL